MIHYQCFSDTDERIQCADQVVQHHKEMVKSTQRGSPFLDTLNAAFNSDINYEVCSSKQNKDIVM